MFARCSNQHSKLTKINTINRNILCAACSENEFQVSNLALSQTGQIQQQTNIDMLRRCTHV